ncbi:MAG: hypothetical protein ACYDCD_13020 [Candidatus Acidiferrales bacterium]
MKAKNRRERGRGKPAPTKPKEKDPTFAKNAKDGHPERPRQQQKQKARRSSRHGRGEPRPYKDKNGAETAALRGRPSDGEIAHKRYRDGRGKPAPTKPKEKDTTLRKGREGWVPEKTKATTKAEDETSARAGGVNPPLQNQKSQSRALAKNKNADSSSRLLVGMTASGVFQ